MIESTADVTWLTQEAHDKLQAELADRSGPLRVEITKRIELAREEGDLKENGGYHAAKEEQGKNEARVRVLKHLLENSRIGVPESADDEVAPGKVVTIRFADGETEKFLLGSREEGATATIEVYSPTSPLGAAVVGHRVGDASTYTLVNGTQMAVEVVDVQAYTPA